MNPNQFDATFVLRVDRRTAWTRLTEHPVEGRGDTPRYWLPGFDAESTVTRQDDLDRLELVKDEEPCAGTDIVVTLADADSGTRITVVQSGFGDWMQDLYDMMAVGWRHIVADLQTYLATGIHAGRHLRPWFDFGTDVTMVDGGLRISAVRADTVAGRLGLRDGDLLVSLAGAPVSNCDDLVTVLRVLGERSGGPSAEWVRDGELRSAAERSPRQS